MSDYKRILVIKLGALGDFVQMTGIYKGIRANWPNAHITLMTGKPFVKIAEKSGYFNDFVEDNRTHSVKDWWRICKKVLADGNYDLVVDLQMQRRTRERYYRLGRLLTKNPYRWAFLPKTGNEFEVRFTPAKKRFLWGKEEKSYLTCKRYSPSLSFCKADPKVLKQLPKEYVLLIPGCSPLHPYKRWDSQNYAELAKRLGQQGINSVVLGTNAEAKEIDDICAVTDKAINFCNKSALLDIPEIAHKAMAVIGNDTGPQHIAELSEVPCITLFANVTKNSAICRDNVHNLFGENINDIPVDKVYQIVQSLWHKA